MASKAKPKAAKRPSRAVNEKPAATKPKGAAGKGERSTATKSKAPLVGAKPTLLAGGNPQIAKADGDAPVQAYIAAMPKGQGPASEIITARIRELRDWRGEKLALVRRLIHDADPAILEEWKWGTPVWSHDGIVCTGETYKQIVKLTFAKGALPRGPPPSVQRGIDGERSSSDRPSGPG